MPRPRHIPGCQLCGWECLCGMGTEDGRECLCVWCFREKPQPVSTSRNILQWPGRHSTPYGEMPRVMKPTPEPAGFVFHRKEHAA